MGRKYEGSIRQKIDELLLAFHMEGKKFCPADVPFPGSVVYSSLLRSRKAGEIERMKKGIYRVTERGEQLIKRRMNPITRTANRRAVAVGVKQIIPAAGSIMDNQFSLEQLGEAVFTTMKGMKDRITFLEHKLVDMKEKMATDGKEYKAIISEKNNTIDELKSKVEALRNRKGTFSLSEVAVVTEPNSIPF